MFHWHLMKFDETCLSVSDMREALYEKWETSYLERDGALAENFKNVSKITQVRYDVIISRDENPINRLAIKIVNNMTVNG